MLAVQVQLPSYGLAKSYLKEWGVQDGPLMYLAASTFSGACVCTVMQPADTVLTRMYNQNSSSSALYSSPIDCFAKTLKAEGVRGLYKGTAAHLMRSTFLSSLYRYLRAQRMAS